MVGSRPGIIFGSEFGGLGISTSFCSTVSGSRSRNMSRDGALFSNSLNRKEVGAGAGLKIGLVGREPGMDRFSGERGRIGVTCGIVGILGGVGDIEM